MKPVIQLIIIEDLEFQLFFDKKGQPVIEVEGIIYSSIPNLFQSFPIITEPSYVSKAAQMSNFLIKGLEFYYIENIERFKEDYQERIDSEQSSFESGLKRLSDFGIYDVSIMHEPLIEGSRLVFFVKDDYTHLPYKVSLTLKDTVKAAEAQYELLPALM